LFLNKPLNEVLLEDEFQKRHLVSINSGSSMTDALRLMTERNIISLPVYGANEMLAGFVDCLDIACYIADNDGDVDATVDDLINASGEDIPLTISGDSRVESVAELFGKGFHRCIVVMSDNVANLQARKHGRVLSQTDLLKYMRNLLSFDSGKGKFSKTGLKLVTVKNDATLEETLKVISANKVNAVALVDSEGKIAGNYSASDLRSFDIGRYTEVKDMTVTDFLDTYSFDYLGKDSPDSLNALCVMQSQMSLEGCARVLDESHYHRLWVVNAVSEPVDVVTVTDVIRELCNAAFSFE
jgi:CBS domain-containing protein